MHTVWKLSFHTVFLLFMIDEYILYFIMVQKGSQHTLTWGRAVTVTANDVFQSNMDIPGKLSRSHDAFYCLPYIIVQR